MEPQLLPTTSVKLGKVSLKHVTHLLLGLLSQVEQLEREIGEIKEAGFKTKTNIKNISQTVNVVKDGLRSLQLQGPWTPKGPNPRLANLGPPTLCPTNPKKSCAPASPVSPSISASPIPSWSTCPPPQAPVANYPAPVKVDHPDAYTGKIGSEAKQWLTRMLACTCLNSWMFPTDQEVLSFLLMNMKDSAGAWAHPHLNQLGSHQAIIQTVKGFKLEFLGVFGNPDATRAAKQKITTLTQSSTCMDYITKKLFNNPNFVLEEEQNRHCAAGACIKCGEMGHKFAECCMGWKANPIEDKGKAKETAKTGKDSEYQLGKEPPYTLYRYYAQWVEPQAGKIWKKAILTFSLDGKQMTETFLICNTGSHTAILGLKWLTTITQKLIGLCAPSPSLMQPPTHGHCQEEEADKNPLEGVPPEYHQYTKVFGEEEFNKLPPHQHYDIGIELTEDGPLNLPLYSMTDAKSTTLKDWLRDKLKAGKIQPSKSSISSPVMFVPKKDGSHRLVVNYCCLNNWTKKNVYPLPCPNNLMAQLRGAKIFIKLDLQWGYNNVCVKEGNEWKTAFRTKYGLYESLVMTFGLTNAPTAFQHFMNKLFKDLLDICVIIYLDDILIYSKTNVDHTQHIHKVLHHLMDNQLFCKASKCTFHITLVEYLGIIVSDKGFSLDKLKIQAVQEWPVPTKVKEVQSFLGFANFLQQFVANFSHMARPLHNLVKKDTPWKWSTAEQEAFQGLKDAITNAPVLCHANPTKPYFLEMDASGAALGSILSQRQEDRQLHPLGFLSESFKGAEQNYNTHDKELLAIICSFEYWQIFLEGTAHPITVSTDHLNLEYRKESCTFNQHHARWHLLLAGYNFQIVYHPSKQSGKPDTLSRHANHANIPPDNQTMLLEPICANIALVLLERELQHQ
ncbi:hypothetical protein RHS01_09084 [Rhizoctonia solani]|uniref:Uncharacterized protein n=1 Tax=Rhizoctonia solani TaxID=456999 RepID=A0A8H7I7D5_9AGAM|nr:hypothetical protein RHS01_09084 [Rhizoctonia solani]